VAGRLKEDGARAAHRSNERWSGAVAPYRPGGLIGITAQAPAGPQTGSDGNGVRWLVKPRRGGCFAARACALGWLLAVGSAIAQPVPAIDASPLQRIDRHMERERQVSGIPGIALAIVNRLRGQPTPQGPSLRAAYPFNVACVAALAVLALIAAAAHHARHPARPVVLLLGLPAALRAGAWVRSRVAGRRGRCGP
jgi:hypothetical protein